MNPTLRMLDYLILSATIVLTLGHYSNAYAVSLVCVSWPRILVMADLNTS